MADNSTAQILQNIAQAQQERIRALNQARVEGAGLFGKSVDNIRQNFNAGEKISEEQQDSQARRDLMAQQLQESQVKTQSAQAEENLMHGDTDPDTGKTRAETITDQKIAAGQQDIDTNAQTLKQNTETHDVAMRQAEQSMRIAATAGKNAADTLNLNKYMDLAKNIAQITDANSPDRAAKMKALNQTFAPKLPHENLSDWAAGATYMGDHQKNADATSDNLAFQTTNPSGIVLKNASDGAMSEAKHFSQAAGLLDTYKKNTYTDIGQGLGINEKANADNARHAFAKIAADHGDVALAANLNNDSISLEDAKQKMQAYIQGGVTGALNTYQEQLGSIPGKYTSPKLPSGAPNPDFKPISAAPTQQLTSILQRSQAPVKPQKTLTDFDIDGNPRVTSTAQKGNPRVAPSPRPQPVAAPAPPPPAPPVGAVQAAVPANAFTIPANALAPAPPRTAVTEEQ